MNQFYGEGVHTFEKLMHKTMSELMQRWEDEFVNHDTPVPLSTELTAYICRIVNILLKVGRL